MTLRRARWLLFAVAGGVLAVLGLLLHRALQVTEAEQELRHRIVADRIFDEVERELTALLDREEARPFLHWSYHYVPENDANQVGLSRSPLAELPSDPAVVGYFQLAPDGKLITPYRSASGHSINPEAELSVVEERLARLTQSLRGRLVAGPPPEPMVPPVVRVKASPRPRPVAQPVAQAEPIDVPLDNLNRGYQQRANRTAQTQSVPEYQTKNWASQADLRDLEQQSIQKGLPAGAPDPVATPEPVAATEPTAAAPPRFELIWDPPPAPPEATEVDVWVAPFEGLLVEDTLVLHRVVKIEGDQWVQGLVLHRPSFQASLERLVLVETGLSGAARLSWSEAAEGAYVFSHGFGAPFAALSASLGLERLASEQTGSWRYLWGLSGLLFAVVASGLLLAYWMIALATRYAQQRADFVAAVTHELKSPLTSIRMYSEMLESGMVPPQRQREYYTTIRTESERLGRLVDDVLVFSRLERGGEGDGRSGTISDAVDEMLKVMSPQVEEAGFTWQLSLPDDLGVGISDQDALVQVLTNLVDNAVKFSRDAQLKVIELSGRRDGEQVALVVRDHGPGVPPGQLDAVFEPFVRGERELTRETRGTGIGLALVKGLVERIQGRIEARNHPQLGFEVTLWLPAVAAES